MMNQDLLFSLLIQLAKLANTVLGQPKNERLTGQEMTALSVTPDLQETLEKLLYDLVSNSDYAGAILATVDAKGFMPVRTYYIDHKALGISDQLSGVQKRKAVEQWVTETEQDISKAIGRQVGLKSPSSWIRINDPYFADNLSVKAIKGKQGRPHPVLSDDLLSLFIPSIPSTLPARLLMSRIQKQLGVIQVAAIPLFSELVTEQKVTYGIVGSLRIASRYKLTTGDMARLGDFARTITRAIEIEHEYHLSETFLANTDERTYLTKLRKNLSDFFSEAELRSLCFELGIDYENLSGSDKTTKARHLIDYCHRRGLANELAFRARENRPDLSWDISFHTSDSHPTDKIEETKDKNGLQKQILQARRDLHSQELLLLRNNPSDPNPAMVKRIERLEAHIEKLVRKLSVADQEYIAQTINLQVNRFEGSDNANLVKLQHSEHGISNKTEQNMSKEKVIEIGKGNTISAPIVIADSIENSFNTLAVSDVNDDIKILLDQLLKVVNEINKKATPEQVEAAEMMARDTETLVKEITSSKPRRRWYEVSIEGLKEAATDIGEIADPVLAIVKKLTPLLLP